MLIFEGFVLMADWFQITFEIVYGTAATRTEEILLTQIDLWFVLFYFITTSVDIKCL